MPSTITESPVALSQIMGASQVGDINVEMCELGDDGSPVAYELGQVMALDPNGNVVKADDSNIARLYGILCQERIVLSTSSERLKSVPIARHGSFKAEMLQVKEGSSLALMAPRLRELGIYLEGLEARIAPPFRLRYLHPNWANFGATNVEILVSSDGSLPTDGKLFFNNTELVTTILNFMEAKAVIPALGGVGMSTIQLRTTTARSNQLMFEVRQPPAPITQETRAAIPPTETPPSQQPQQPPEPPQEPRAKLKK